MSTKLVEAKSIVLGDLKATIAGDTVTLTFPITGKNLTSSGKNVNLFTTSGFVTLDGERRIRASVNVIGPRA